MRAIIDDYRSLILCWFGGIFQSNLWSARSRFSTLLFVSPKYFAEQEQLPSQSLEAGCRFLSFKRSKLLISNIKQKITIYLKIFSQCCHYLRKMEFEVNFLGSANKKSEFSVCVVCLLISFWWNWRMTLLTTLIGKSAQRYFSLVVPLSWSKYILIWYDRFRSSFIAFLWWRLGTLDVQCVGILFGFLLIDVQLYQQFWCGYQWIWRDWPQLWKIYSDDNW